MPLAPGVRLGPYEVTALIGEGGMGKVWRAHHTALKRDDALKVLPDAFASDPERLARFRREAQVLASLNHPNIAHVYGLEQADGIQALVMELVEGPTLAERIAKGPIPVDEALPIAKQIAEALEAAHEHAIIHRDLKPANVKVRPDGVVKVLDFGLAKALDSASATIDASHSPTITSPAMMTNVGVILGTAAYMSPEQARGKSVDKRTDIWAFGCVLYEMLTGARAFRGETVSETLAFIMMKEPNWSALPSSIPPAIAKLIRRCLEKDPKRRLPDIGVARLEIDEELERPNEQPAQPPTLTSRPSRWRRAAMLAVALQVGSAVAGTAVRLAMRPVPPRVVRLTMSPTGSAAIGLGGIAITPDGTRLVYVGDSGGIVVRALDQLEPTAILGVGLGVGASASRLFFSPDGRWIGFSDNVTTIKRVAIAGGPAATVTGVTASLSGATWGADDTIIFAISNTYTGLSRVAATGGKPEVLTTPNRTQGEVLHLWPHLLPGDHAVLFTIRSAAGIENDQIAVLDLSTRAQKVLIRGASDARYVPTGHLVYGAAGTLRAVRFDLNRLELLGTPVPVLEQVRTTGSGAMDMSLSSDGTLVYVPGGVQVATTTLVWVDRQGRAEALKAPPHGYGYLRLSPDGSRVAFQSAGDIWIWDFVRETLTRFTLDPELDQYAVWTPDGRRLAFRSQRGGGPYNLFWQAADGTGPVERLTESPNEHAPYAFSADGKRLLVREDKPDTDADLAWLTLEGERRLEPLVHTRFHERNGEISPDGRWLAYQSDESGQFEIYVRPLPDVDSGRWQISTGGGTRPVWARSGKELFYVVPGNAMMSVPTEGSGSTFRAGKPSKLFDGRSVLTSGAGRTYDVSPDGQRFLMGGGPDATPTSIVVVQNWLEELKRLVPAN